MTSNDINYIAYTQMAEYATKVFPYVIANELNEEREYTLEEVYKATSTKRATFNLDTDKDGFDEIAECDIDAGTFKCHVTAYLIFGFLHKFAKMAGIKPSKRITFTKHAESHTEPQQAHTEPQTRIVAEVSAEDVMTIISENKGNWTLMAQRIFELLMQRSNITTVEQRTPITYELRKKFRALVIPIEPYFGTKKGTDALCHGLYKLSIPTKKTA